MTSRSGRAAGGERSAVAAERVEVGRIVRPHGVRGEVAIAVSSDVPGRFAPGSRLTATPPGRPPLSVTIDSTRPHRDLLLVRLAGVGDRDAAAELSGAVLEVQRSEVPAAPVGHWYYFELVGCRCEDPRHGVLGLVTDVVEDGGGLLLRVVGDGRELLVPFVEALVREVDVEGRRIDLELPEGLVESCGSG